MSTVLCADGTTSAPSAGNNFVIYWDADEWRELEDANKITKASGTTLLTCSQCSGSNATKSTPGADRRPAGRLARGNHLARNEQRRLVRVYTTTDVTNPSHLHTMAPIRPTRAQVALWQSGYNQPPHTGFRISPIWLIRPSPRLM